MYSIFLFNIPNYTATSGPFISYTNRKLCKQKLTQNNVFVYLLSITFTLLQLRFYYAIRSQENKQDKDMDLETDVVQEHADTLLLQTLGGLKCN